jgi:hypothetical protein
VSLSRGGDRLLATEGQDRLIKDKQDDNSANALCILFHLRTIDGNFCSQDCDTQIVKPTWW